MKLWILLKSCFSKMNTWRSMMFSIYVWFTWSTVCVDVLVVLEMILFFWHTQQFGWVVSTLSFGDDNDVTREGDIIGGGVLDILW